MVRTRFAPSPTGTPQSVHLGFVIRALWNYAYAHKNNGQFVLRLEDTDQARSRKDTEEAIYRILGKFGIRWDEGPDIGGPHAPYRQSERLSKYQEAAHQLVSSGYAYYDFDAVKKELKEIKDAYKSHEKLVELQTRPTARSLDFQLSRQRVEAGEPYVVRAKIPEDKVFEYTDWILKKKIVFYSKHVPDMILLKSDGFPTYHLAVVVDDSDMRISHVFRGQEWISSTPIHLHIYEGLKLPIPEIGHFTVILDSSTHKKFSKRDLTGKFGVNYWLDQGFLPEAVLNYLMLLGWAPKDNREFFTLDEFVMAFDQDGIQKANPNFDPVKLEWFNAHYIRQKSDEELIQLIKPYFDHPKLAEIIPLIKDRITKLSDVPALTSFFVSAPSVTPDSYLSPDHLRFALANYDRLVAGELIEDIKSKGWKVGDFFMSLRVAVCGSRSTPPITETMLILGKEESIKRIKRSLE